MNNISTVFKITTKDCKSALSLGNHWCPDMTVTYSTEKWALSNDLMGIKTPLFVFGSLEDASKFFHNSSHRYNNNWVIWEAQAVNARSRATRLKVGKNFCVNAIYNFWKRISRSNVRCGPEGTLICDAVKLTKIVDPLS